MTSKLTSVLAAISVATAGFGVAAPVAAQTRGPQASAMPAPSKDPVMTGAYYAGDVGVVFYDTGRGEEMMQLFSIRQLNAGDQSGVISISTAGYVSRGDGSVAHPTKSPRGEILLNAADGMNSSMRTSAVNNNLRHVLIGGGINVVSAIARKVVGNNYVGNVAVNNGVYAGRAFNDMAKQDADAAKEGLYERIKMVIETARVGGRGIQQGFEVRQAGLEAMEEQNKAVSDACSKVSPAVAARHPELCGGVSGTDRSRTSGGRRRGSQPDIPFRP